MCSDQTTHFVVKNMEDFMGKIPMIANVVKQEGTTDVVSSNQKSKVVSMNNTANFMATFVPRQKMKANAFNAFPVQATEVLGNHHMVQVKVEKDHSVKEVIKATEVFSVKVEKDYSVKEVIKATEVFPVVQATEVFPVVQATEVVAMQQVKTEQDDHRLADKIQRGKLNESIRKRKFFDSLQVLGFSSNNGAGANWNNNNNDAVQLPVIVAADDNGAGANWNNNNNDAVQLADIASVDDVYAARMEKMLKKNKVVKEQVLKDKKMAVELQGLGARERKLRVVYNAGA